MEPKSQKTPQLEPQGHQNDAKRVQMGAESGPRDPNWSHKGTKRSPKGSQGAPKGAKREPKVSQKSTKVRGEFGFGKGRKKPPPPTKLFGIILDDFCPKTHPKIDAEIDPEKT